jgi:hypothetical protein
MDYSIEIVFYNIFFTYFVPYILANRVRLGVSIIQAGQLSTYLGTWNTLFGLYADPETFGSITIGDMNTFYDTLKKYVDGLKQQIKTTLGLVLTSTDYRVTQIHKDLQRRTSISRPKEEAAVSLRKLTHGVNYFSAYDVDNPTKAGKPKDVKKIGIRLYTRKRSTGEIVEVIVSDLLIQPDSGSMKFELHFLDTQAGDEGFVAVCFINDKGEKGEWSQIFPFGII